MSTTKPASNVTVHARTRAYDGFFKIDKLAVSFVTPQGHKVDHAIVEIVERGDSACALLHDVANKCVILTEQLRLPAYEKGSGWMIEAMAGSVGTEETPEACIRREAMEEVGYALGPLELIARYFTSPGGASERVFVYYAPVSDADLKDATAHGVAGEHEAVGRVVWSEAELFAALDAGTLEDAKLIIPAMWLRRRLEAPKAITAPKASRAPKARKA